MDQQRRWTVTTAEGAVIGCDSQADLTEALVAIRRAANGTQAEHEPETKRSRAWTPQLVRALLEVTSRKAVIMVEAAVKLGHDATAIGLAAALDRPAGALGPMFGKVQRDAAAIDATLPIPVELVGGVGAKHLCFDPGFLAAAKEVLSA